MADEGEHVLALTATDSAGNVTSKQWDLVVDYKAPKVTASGLPEDEVWKEHNSAAGTVQVADYFPDKLEVSGSLDGAALALEESEADSTGERAYNFDTGTLAEGTHELVVSATDLGGHVTTLERSFLVDTSSTFGSRTLKTGAVGGDVQQLQRILAIKGAYAGEPDGTSGESTAVAVEAFNAEHGIDGGAVVTDADLRVSSRRGPHRSLRAEALSLRRRRKGDKDVPRGRRHAQVPLTGRELPYHQQSSQPYLEPSRLGVGGRHGAGPAGTGEPAGHQVDGAQ